VLSPLSGTQFITVVVDVNSPLANGTVLTNTVDITSTEGATNTAVITTGVTSAPVFGLLKTESQDPIGAGERLTYTIAYSNSGNAVATGVLVTDTLDSNVTLVSVAPPTTTQAGQVLGWSVGVLSPLSGTQFITVVVDVNPVPTGGLLVNNVEISSAEGAGDTAQATTTLLVPVLGLSKTDSADPVNPGDTLVYTISYSNTGNTAATGLIITDTLPADVNATGIVSTASGAVFNGGTFPTFSWTDASLPAATLETIVISVTVGAPLPDMTVLTDVVTMTAVNTATVLTDLETTTVRAADVSVSKTVAPDPALAGDPIVYTITYSNVAGAPSAAVTITDTLPVSVSVSGVISSGVATFSSFVPPRTFVWGDIVPGGSVRTIVVTSTVITGPWPAILLDMTNAVTIAMPVPELNQADNAGSVTSQGGPNLPFTITLTAAPNPVQVQGPAFITATVQDPFGNPVLNGTGVSFSTDLGSITPSGTTGNGQASVDLTSNTAGVATVTAQANSVTRTTTVTFTPGPAASFIFSPPVTTQTAGIPFTITIIAVDSFNNVATGFNSAVTLADTTGTIAPTTSGPFSSGIWTGTVTITKATTISPPTDQITATFGAASGSSNNFEVLPGPPAQAVLTVDTPRQCGGTAIQSAVVRDQFGNEVLAGEVVTFTASAGSIESPVTTNNAGLATAVLTAPLGPPPTATVTVDVDGVPPVEGSDVVTFATPGLPTDLTVVAVPPTVPIMGSATVTATVADCTANPLGNALVTFGIISNPGGASLSPSGGQTNAAGVFSGTFTAGVFGGVALVQTSVSTFSTSLTTTTAITITGAPGFSPLKLVEPNTVTVTGGSTLTYTVIVSNTGDAIASGVRITDAIPSGATYVPGSASAVLDEPGSGLTSLPVSGPTPLVVDVGTITPGGVVTFNFQVTASTGPTVTNVATVGSNQLPDVNSNSVSTGVGAGLWTIHLPLIMKQHIPPLPDLVVDLVEVSPVSPSTGQDVVISVTIRNAGLVSIPSSRTFWVDVYITTSSISPGVNTRWNDISGAHGVAWRVPGLAAGQSLTFSNLVPNQHLIDPGNCDNFSDFTPSTVGSCSWPANSNRFSAVDTYFVVAQVDTFAEDASVSDGNITEGDESNNLSTEVTVVVVPGLTLNESPGEVREAAPAGGPAAPGGPRPALLPKEE
ncbi:MAG: beta strand repeat-containing protein, partial [Anaerolineae bacterium]